MKINVLKYAIAVLPLLGATACLDFDNPEDIFTDDQKTVDPVVFHGNADNLKSTYAVTASQSGTVSFSVNVGDEVKAGDEIAVIGSESVLAVRDGIVEALLVDAGETVAEGDEIITLVIEPTEEEVDAAIETLQDDLGTWFGGQTYLLGGKGATVLQEHAYQFYYSLTVDGYAGYTTNINSSFMSGFTLETTYAYAQSPNEGPYSRLLDIKNAFGNLLNRNESNTVVELKALALLEFNLVAQEVTDLYGAIPYVDLKANKTDNPFTFNKGIDIYYSIIQNLDDINECLENFKSRPQWYQDKLNEQLAMFDACTETRSFETWRKAANTLKLRMAMHLVKVRPDDAKRFAEEAIEAGVIEARNDQLGVFGSTFYGSLGHPIKMMQTGWNDSRLTADFICLLQALNHPYMNYLIADNNYDFNNATTGATTPTGTLKVGVRRGLRMEPAQQYYANMRLAFSTLNFNDPMENANWMPFYIMKWSEVDFLRAEGALRGWNMGGTAEFFYNRGIDNADCSDVFMMPSGNYDQYLAAYKEVETPTTIHYVDPMDDANNADFELTIGVKWDESDSDETKLEKIITQKFIAAFPYSYESWGDLRRTGYPLQFPVLNVAMANDGSLAEGQIIRRMRLPHGDTAAGMQDIADSGLEALSGVEGGSSPDVIATRVFWDLEAPNF